jgi:hypothetical protein
MTTALALDLILSPQELMTAAMVGVRRQISAMANGRAHWGVLSSSETSAFDNHIIGAMAEFAVAKHFHLFWSDNVGSVTGRDVGGEIEVRCRRVGGSGLDLAMRPHDKPAMPYLLVHAAMPKFTLVGWIYGCDAESLGMLNESTGLRYVVASSLRPLDELQTMLRGKLAS